MDRIESKSIWFFLRAFAHVLIGGSGEATGENGLLAGIHSLRQGTTGGSHRIVFTAHPPNVDTLPSE
jgi:hypothetical protein